MKALKRRDSPNQACIKRESTNSLNLYFPKSDLYFNLLNNMQNYGDPQYWEDRYKENKGKLFDWLEDFTAIESVFNNLIEKSSPLDRSSDDWKSQIKILNLGCGNSLLAEELYDRGFKSVHNNDISFEVIKQMQERNAEKRPELVWEVMDVREMTYDSNFFDIIIDKSTIDALLCGDEAFINTA